LTACSDDKNIKLFDISELPAITPKLIQVPKSEHTNSVYSISFSSDNFLLASAGTDKQLIIYSFSEKNNSNINN